MTPDPAPAASHRASATVILQGAALAYSHRQDPELSGLDLELTRGRPVALTGPGGSGKTSVVLALLRFIDLSAGQLTVNGMDALAMPPEQIRALIARSPEQPTLFPAPLRQPARRRAARHGPADYRAPRATAAQPVAGPA